MVIGEERPELVEFADLKEQMTGSIPALSHASFQETAELGGSGRKASRASATAPLGHRGRTPSMLLGTKARR